MVPWIIRHAGYPITRCRVRSNGRTSYQFMKSRRTTAKLLQFAEVVLFKVPKPHHRVGKFEDRWDIGVWVGFLMWTGEHLVVTKNRGLQGANARATICRHAMVGNQNKCHSRNTGRAHFWLRHCEIISLCKEAARGASRAAGFPAGTRDDGRARDVAEGPGECSRYRPAWGI